MISRQFIFGLGSLCFTLIAHAGDMGLPLNPYFISLSAGPAWTDAGTTQTITLQSDLVNTYVPQNLTNLNILGNGEIFVGIQKSFFEQVQSQFGLAYYFSPDIS